MTKQSKTMKKCTFHTTTKHFITFFCKSKCLVVQKKRCKHHYKFWVKSCKQHTLQQLAMYCSICQEVYYSGMKQNDISLGTCDFCTHFIIIKKAPFIKKNVSNFCGPRRKKFYTQFMCTMEIKSFPFGCDSWCLFLYLSLKVHST